MKLAMSCVAAFSILAVLALSKEWVAPRPVAAVSVASMAQEPPARPRDGDLPVAGAAPAPRRDGNWNVTVETTVPGFSHQPRPVTYTHCVTKEDAEDPAKLVPLTGRGGDEKPTIECKRLDEKLEGAKVSWMARCEGISPMTGVGEFVYGVDSYVGTMTVTVTRDGQPATMTMNYSANRLGDCEKSGISGFRRDQ